MIKIVSFSNTNSAPFTKLLKKPYPTDIDITENSDLITDIRNPLQTLEINQVEISKIHLLKKMPGYESIFVQYCSEDSMARAIRLKINNEESPQNIFFLDAVDSRLVVEHFRKIDELYRKAGAVNILQEAKLIFDFLSLSAERELNSIIYSDLRQQDFE